MKIGIVGLGLMGGSFLKAFKKYTDCECLIYDKSPDVTKKALSVADGLLEGRLCDCDIVMISLYPGAAIDYINDHAGEFKKGSIVTDCCGVKEGICKEASKTASENGFYFIGGHPMAGVENSGFDYSDADMYKGASMVLVKCDIDDALYESFKSLILKLGFGNICETDATTHDKMIAFTSQLAHVVSGAYMKSPSAMKHYGFSAGSFKDMTRVAKLNEVMWTELFMENSDYLAEEIGIIIGHLEEYRLAIKNKEKNKIFDLLKDGSDRKKTVIEYERREKDAEGKS